MIQAQVIKNIDFNITYRSEYTDSEIIYLWIIWKMVFVLRPKILIFILYNLIYISNTFLNENFLMNTYCIVFFHVINIIPTFEGLLVMIIAVFALNPTLLKIHYSALYSIFIYIFPVLHSMRYFIIFLVLDSLLSHSDASKRMSHPNWGSVILY